MEQAHRLERLMPAEDAPATKEAAARGPGAWWIALVGVQVVLAAAILAGGLWAKRQAEALTSAAQAHAMKIDALAADSAAIKEEVAGVRQAVASHAREESLYLKVLLLKPEVDPELARSIAGSVGRYSELYGRDPNLALAIIAAESDFDPRAKSSAGAVGLMQVMPHWKKVLGINADLTDPEASIRYGLQILGFYQEMYKDLDVALTAYNRGPGPVDGALMRGKQISNGYAPRVMATYERLRKLDSAARP